MAKETGWILSLRKAGTPAADAPELVLNDAEMNSIRETVMGSCLAEEEDITWLLRAAGVPMPKTTFNVSFSVAGEEGQDEELGDVIHMLMTAAGLEPRYGVDVDK